MTTPGTTQENQLSAEEMDQLGNGLKKCAEQQPTVHLLNLDENLSWYAADGGKHFLSLGGHDVLFDPDAGLFTPVDPEPIRQLLVDKLAQTHGATEFDVGGTPRAIDWASTQIVTEQGGQISATATTVPGADGVAEELRLQIDMAWQVTLEPPPGRPAPAEPDTGPRGETAAEPVAPAIDGSYLNTYYQGHWFEFNGQVFMIDWLTWNTDQTTPDGLTGSRVRATGNDGGSYELYIWFGFETGVQIVQATMLAAPPVVTEPPATAPPAAETPAAETTEVDPRVYFDDILSQQLRDLWDSAGKVFIDHSGNEYDVSGWIDGEFDSSLQLLGFDEHYYYAELGAAKVIGGEPQRVLLQLRIQDAETIWVDREEALS